MFRTREEYVYDITCRNLQFGSFAFLLPKCTSISFHFQAIWENQFYYLFGFLFLVYVILIISCSQISIVMVYFQLCGEVSRQKGRFVVNSAFKKALADAIPKERG